MAKVLLIAYACDGEDVSETWCSWQWTRRLVERHDATVLVYNKTSRKGALAAALPGARILEWTELPLFERFPSLTHSLKPGYLDFYFRARRSLKALLAAGKFDLIHQYEPFAPRYPSPAAGLGVPFVLGPVGGCVETPHRFEKELAGDTPWFVNLRRLDQWRFRKDPWLRHTYSSADLVLGIAPYVRNLLAPVDLRRFELFHETGVDRLPEPKARRVERKRGDALRLLYVGRVVRSKGVRDAVRAMAALKDLPNVTLDVVGDGGDRVACETEAAALGVAGQVRFHRWQPREVVDWFYANSDVFVFPSLREASGQVVIEAMSHGLPLVVASNGGPGFTVDSHCGIRLHPYSPEEYARSIAGAVRELASSPARLDAMGQAARDRVAAEFLWDRKVDRMSALYEDVLSRAGRLPLPEADGCAAPAEAILGGLS